MSTLAKAYRDHPLHLHHIIPLDFDSVRAVPDTHTWPKSDVTPSDEDYGLSVPTVDLRDPDAARSIGHACETWGVFQVTNHGISLKLLDEVKFQSRRLFSLPASQKLKVLRSPNGATGYGTARISPFFNKYMWHEGFTVMGSPVDHARTLWPLDYHRFCAVMEDYQKKIKELATTLMRLILTSLNISAEEMKWVCSNGTATTALQLNSYPLCPDPDQAMGLAPHTDTSLLTILHQSNNSACGLQIFKEGVGWVMVRPITGALVVNVGDLLHILSNARFPSVLHRVVMKEARQQRLSVACFCCPPTDFRLSPLSCDSCRIPLYRPVSVAEYIGIKCENLHNALSIIRVSK